MNCKKIQELIITDYSDGEISAGLKREVDNHLRLCGKCKQFKEALQKTAVEPFKGVERAMPPDSLWENIREAIAFEEDQETKDIFSKLHNFLRTVFTLRKPVFAFAAIMIVVITTAVFMRARYNNDMITSYLEKQADFIAYLDTDVSTDSADFINLDIDIEGISYKGNFSKDSFV